MTNNYVNMDFIIERFNKVKIQGGSFNEEELLEWTYEALQEINNRENLINIKEILHLRENKVKLPFEIQNILKVEDANNTQLHESYNGFELKQPDDYIINNGYLYTNAISPITIYYSTIPLDENDRPLIPDENYLIKAIISYLRFKVGERAFWAGKILNVQYNLLKQDWLWNLPSAQHTPKMRILEDPTKFARVYSRHFYK